MHSSPVHGYRRTFTAIDEENDEVSFRRKTLSELTWCVKQNPTFRKRGIVLNPLGEEAFSVSALKGELFGHCSVQPLWLMTLRRRGPGVVARATGARPLRPG